MKRSIPLAHTRGISRCISSMVPHRRLLIIMILLSFPIIRSAYCAEWEIGAGLFLDIAPFGIESKRLMVHLSCWPETRSMLQPGGSLAIAARPEDLAISMTISGRYFPASSFFSLVTEFGALVFLDSNGTSIIPEAAIMTRFELGSIALLCPIIHVCRKPSDFDSGIGILVTSSL